MVPLGWSGGSQFSLTVLPVGAPVMVSIRGGVGAVDMAVGGVIVMGIIGESRKFTPTFERT